MAEEGAFSSFTYGSDACVEHYCTPCWEDILREEAVKYCPECDEYLCARCTRHHTMRKATKSHKLVDKKDAKENLHAVRTKCLYHPDQDIEMFCGTHDMVYCLLCIVTDHRSCEHVNKIDVNLATKVEQNEITKLLDEMTKVKESLNDTKIKQTKNLSSLEEQKHAIHEHLKDIEEKMIQHIRKLKEKATKSVNERYDVMKEKLSSEIKLTSLTMESLNESSQQMQSIDNYNAEQKFIYLKMTKNTIADANTIHAKSITKGTSSIDFTERPELAEFIRTLDSFGQVEESNKSPIQIQYKVKATKEINVQLVNDKTTCNISDICQLPDGRILLTDQRNRKVKMFDIDFNIIDSYEVESFPMSICCVSWNNVAVKMNNNKVQFISVTSSLSKTRSISIDGGVYYGMAFCNDRLLVSGGYNGIFIYSTTGDRIKSIENIQNGKIIFKKMIQHMAVSADTVIVTDSSDGAAIFNKDFTVIGELRDSRLNNIRGVCIADDGTVFLCGYGSNNIVMFSKDGKCIGEVVGKGYGLNRPINMCFDRNKNSLIVTTYTSDTLKIFELAH